MSAMHTRTDMAEIAAEILCGIFEKDGLPPLSSIEIALQVFRAFCKKPEFQELSDLEQKRVFIWLLDGAELLLGEVN